MAIDKRLADGLVQALIGLVMALATLLATPILVALVLADLVKRGIAALRREPVVELIQLLDR
jgi:hypothetical protein